MQSLLSPAESHAFQSFLSTVDVQDDDHQAADSIDWQLFAPSSGQQPGQDDILVDPHQNQETRDALTRATKDLMALDPESWNAPTNPPTMTQRNHHAHHAPYDLYAPNAPQYDHMHQQHQNQHSQQLLHDPVLQQHSSFSHDPFPFLHANKHQQHQQQQHRQGLQQQQQMQQTSMSYPLTALQIPQGVHHQSHLHHLSTTLNGDHSHSPSSLTPTSPRLGYPNFPPPSSHRNSIPVSIHPVQSQQQVQQSHPAQLLPHQRQGSSGARSSAASTSSSSAARTNGVGSSSSSSGAASSSRRTTRQSASTSGSNASPISPSSSSTNGSTANGSTQQQQSQSSKPALLSPSQKKANHIQSEQKRRANIRRGYEALCETVPALREAIREEEEQERLAAAGLLPNGKSKKRSKKPKDVDTDGAGKIDGRAGPRSENVVLSKTIDHIQQLLADQAALLARLNHAKSVLPPHHPALAQCIPDPPWEREWKGGEGKLGDDDGDGEGGGSGDDDGFDGDDQ